MATGDLGAAVTGSDMVLNIGPQHPATHGVLRLRLTLDGERIVHAEPVVGYMHRGAEKLFEVRDYRQIIVLANRHDWLSAFANELGVVLAVERMLGMEVPVARGVGAHAARRAEPRPEPPDVPRVVPARGRRDHAGLLRVPRARGAAGGDGGGLRRPDALHVQPRRRPQGGPAGRLAGRARQTVADVRRRLPVLRDARARQRDLRGAYAGRRGARAAEQVLQYGVSGPIARASGRRRSTCAWTSRTSPTASSPTPARCVADVGPTGDCLARFEVLAEQVDVSLDLADACASTGSTACRPDRSTSGCRRCEGARGRRRTRGRRTRSASTATTWSRRGEKTPWRLKLRTASFNNVQALPELLEGCTLRRHGGDPRLDVLRRGRRRQVVPRGLPVGHAGRR